MTVTLDRDLTRESFTTSYRASGSRRKSKGPFVIRWVETHCVYTQGRWIGKRVRLLPWQKAYLMALFEVDPETRLRRIRWTLLGVPKKNGKTELAAWLALYFLIGDGEASPLVGVAAGSDEQADLVFGAAKRCADLSPTLREITQRFEKEILVPSIPGAKLRRLSAAAGTNDGPSWFVVICDELHEWSSDKGRKLWDILTNGTGARIQPMVIQLTTAGYDKESVCYEQYEICQRICSGEIDDPAYLFWWYEAPEGCDHRDLEFTVAANPSYGEIQQEAFYVDQLRRKTENTYRRYFLNQWTSSEEAWLPFNAWDGIRGSSEQPADGADIVLGFDGSYNNDSTALIGCTVEKEPHLFVVGMWEKPYRDTGAWRVPVLDVEAKIVEACEKWEVREIACDPARWARTYAVLEERGLPIEEFPQSPQRMVPATQRFYESVINKHASHDGDVRLTRHVANAVVRADQRGSRIYKDPSAPTRKIDGAVAAIMALHRATWWWEEMQGGFSIF
jgi:phage terminase large subunit-like protein